MYLEELIWSYFEMIKGLKLSVMVNDVTEPTRSCLMTFFVTDLPLHSYFFQEKKKRNQRHIMRSEWFYLMHCEMGGPPFGRSSRLWPGREGRACVLRACLRRRACACVSEEGRHCSLTSPFSPAIRCSQTGLCYSEASTGDRPSAKHGTPPGVWNGPFG